MEKKKINSTETRAQPTRAEDYDFSFVYYYYFICSFGNFTQGLVYVSQVFNRQLHHSPTTRGSAKVIGIAEQGEVDHQNPCFRNTQKTSDIKGRHPAPESR